MAPAGGICVPLGTCSSLTQLSTVFQSYQDDVWLLQGAECGLVVPIFSSPEQRSWRAVVLPPASASALALALAFVFALVLALASTNVKVLL